MSLIQPATRLLLLSFIAASCVPGRKYEELNQRYKAQQAEVEAADARSREAQATLEAQQAHVKDLEGRHVQLIKDTADQAMALRRMQRQYDKINQLNDELLDKYNQLLSGDRSENRKLLTNLEEMRLRMLNKEDSLDALSASLSEREQKLAELQAELARKDAAMKGLKERVSKALTGFEGKGLTVEQRNGKIYVSMENKLLFPSGSTSVDGKGREALVSLARAVENEKDLNIMVEGHTDVDQVKPGSAFADNWDLSVMRATSVVRILQQNSKLDPTRVTAAGRSEYVPVDPADKAKNRRIEVILAPDLKELYKLVTE